MIFHSLIKFVAILSVSFLIVSLTPMESEATEDQSFILQSEAAVESFDPDGVFTFGENGSLDLNGDALKSLDGVMLVLKYSTPDKGYDDKILLRIHSSVEPSQYLPLKNLLDERGYTARLFFFSEEEKT